MVQRSSLPPAHPCAEGSHGEDEALRKGTWMPDPHRTVREESRMNQIQETRPDNHVKGVSAITRGRSGGLCPPGPLEFVALGPLDKGYEGRGSFPARSIGPRLGAQGALQRCLILRAGDVDFTTLSMGDGNHKQVGASVSRGYTIPPAKTKNGGAHESICCVRSSFKE